ncbi:M24 family metallopeptidase [Verticiella sediminum]|uniref:Xaa-Pro aminopeptidase n=1 Tax=Verticiella sediminum TaxID=1247510 RepID=A0A556B308_9BURK|nr:aminopeptidase P N-terminal domain-containing protein [Verticiella sediminum]TSH99225.1 M24 family metallopeptidase [Verticiella sediminum]
MPIPAQDTAPFAARRRRVMDLMRAAGGGIAILPTAPETIRNLDSDYPFRHDSDFYYLTGFPEPEAWLVLVAGDTDKSILFCRSKHPEREIWDGYRYGPEAAGEHFRFDESYPLDELDKAIPELLAGHTDLYAPLASCRLLDDKLPAWLAGARMRARAGVHAPVRQHDLRALVASLRLVKEPGEIALMRRAGQISAAGHVRAMRATRPGLHEYEIEAELLYEFRRHGAQAVAYNSIVAAGANACVLHYRAGDTVMRDGELLLIDAGCEYDSYAGDITRTFPVNGRYSGPQRELYDVTVAAQAAAAAATRPGARWNEPHDAAVRVLAQGMLDAGLLQGSLDGVIESNQYTRFYMHRTGHWLGMDVHDVGDYREDDEEGGRDWRRLDPGMALTIEPGIYVRPGEGVPEAYWNIGIRTEDDAIVTDSGCELITRDVPVQADEIEALMRG